MLNEIDILGIFISPLLLCMLIAFFTRLMISSLMTKAGLYSWVARRPIFDIALFISLTGLMFHLFNLITTPAGNTLL